MKKTIFFFLLALTTIGTLIFQSCTKETNSDKPLITAKVLISDSDFQALALLENEIKSRIKIFDANLSSAHRKDIKFELRELTKKGTKTATQGDLLRIAQIFGYQNVNELQNVRLNYSKLYFELQKKYKHFDNYSVQSFDEAFSIAYVKNQLNLPWKLRKDKNGDLLMTPTNISLTNLTTLQVRSCGCEYPECNRDFDTSKTDCDTDLRRDLLGAVNTAAAGAVMGGAAGSTVAVGTIPGAVVGGITGGILGLGIAAWNFDDCMDTANNNFCSCIKEQNPNCRCN